MTRAWTRAAALVCLALACGRDRQPRTGEVGAQTSAETAILAAGARILQTNAPAAALDIHLAAFHPMKDDPSYQMEVHHFCRQLNQDLAQCALFDGTTPDSHLNGIEYIISETLYERLPAAERRYWHPHNYEILSGMLMAPGLPEAAELALMRTKMNSYGKTWHVWMTGADGRGSELLPLGEPHLGWSFNADGEIRPGMIEARDRAMRTSTEATRAGRQALVPLAHPQVGVDALAPAFATRHKPPGVEEAKKPGSGRRSPR